MRTPTQNEASKIMIEEMLNYWFVIPCKVAQLIMEMRYEPPPINNKGEIIPRSKGIEPNMIKKELPMNNIVVNVSNPKELIKQLKEIKDIK